MKEHRAIHSHLRVIPPLRSSLLPTGHHSRPAFRSEATSPHQLVVFERVEVLTPRVLANPPWVCTKMHAVGVVFVNQ